MSAQKPSWKFLPTDRTGRAIWGLNSQIKPEQYVTMVREIDASGMDRLRKQLAAEGHPKPSYTAIMTKAVACMLQQYPQLNRCVLGLPFFKRMVQLTSYDIAVAADLSEPDKEHVTHPILLRNVDQRSCVDLTAELQQHRSQKLTAHAEWQTFKKITSRLPLFLSKLVLRSPTYFPDVWLQTRGSACWVNSPAKAGVDLVFTTWPWPVTFSFGLVADRPIAIEGRVEVRRTVPLVLVFDRRILGGGPAAQIFQQYCQLLWHADIQQAAFMSTSSQSSSHETDKALMQLPA